MADETEHLRMLLAAAESEAEQWWLLAAQYRNTQEHAGPCIGNRCCRLCVLFHRNEDRYGKHHPAQWGPQ